MSQDRPSLSNQCAESVRSLANVITLAMSGFVAARSQEDRDRYAKTAQQAYERLDDQWRRFDAALSVSGEPLKSRGLEKLAAAVLLFHRGGTWTDNDRQMWLALTDTDEATTKTLCDFARKVQANG
jgi:hypothetical protein